jgi:hypothetical protein
MVTLGVESALDEREALFRANVHAQAATLTALRVDDGS